MKGVVFTLLQEVVTAEHGEATWDALLDEAGLDGVYTVVGTYPDEQLGSLITAASAATGSTADEIQVWFGRKALPLLAERYEAVFEGHTNARSFVLTLNDVIHPQVRKLFPGAYAPSFDFDTSRPNAVALAYDSTRDLCRFAEGLVHGAAAHFGETAEVVHKSCRRDGAERCVLDCTFASGH